MTRRAASRQHVLGDSQPLARLSISAKPEGAGATLARHVVLFALALPAKERWVFQALFPMRLFG